LERPFVIGRYYGAIHKILSPHWPATQMDDSRDMSNHVILLLYVMFIDYCKEDFKEEMLVPWN
jgi:hypothetical protein